MKICCTKTFREEYNRYLKNNSYTGLPNALLGYLSGKSIQDFTNGDLLNQNPQFPFIKDRIEGSGGYRVYFFVQFSKDRIVLGYLHPKTGKNGRINTTKEERKRIFEDIRDHIKEDALIEIVLNEEIRFIES